MKTITQIKIFKESCAFDISERVSEFLKTLKPDELIDIKYEMNRYNSGICVVYSQEQKD